MRLKQKLILAGITILGCLTSEIARAQGWVYVGSVDGYQYYVDVDEELADGPIWSAPLEMIGSDGYRYDGMIAIDCQKYMVGIRIGDDRHYQGIKPDSIPHIISQKVCSN